MKLFQLFSLHTRLLMHKKVCSYKKKKLEIEKKKRTGKFAKRSNKVADLLIFTWPSYENCIMNIFSNEATPSGFSVLLLFKHIVANSLSQMLKGVLVTSLKDYTQLTFTCSNSTIETLKSCVKYVQSNNKNTRTTLLTSNWRFYY